MSEEFHSSQSQQIKTPNVEQLQNLLDHSKTLKSSLLHQEGGILLVDKLAGSTSFHLVSLLRKLTGIQKIGHAGTLDPFATGVMVLLIGSKFTKLSDQFLNHDKQYLATLHLGVTTDSYDIDGNIVSTCETIPQEAQIEQVIEKFQGSIEQIPPMFSAKKIQGKKLYELARKGISIERPKSQVQVSIKVLGYQYPNIDILVDCSKGTYIRSLAHDIGLELGCGAHLSSLTRTRSGDFTLEECISENLLKNLQFDITPYLKSNI